MNDLAQVKRSISVAGFQQVFHSVVNMRKALRMRPRATRATFSAFPQFA
jgi:hypothetical protein